MADASDGMQRNWVAGRGVVDSLVAVRGADGTALLASTGPAGQVLLHEPSGRLVRELAEHRWARLVGTVPAAGGRELLVLAGIGDRIRLVDPDSGRPIRHLAAGDVRATAGGVTGDGRTVLVTGGSDRAVMVWDAESGTLLHRLPAHKAEVSVLAVDADFGGDLLLASADGNGVIRVWTIGSAATLIHELTAPGSSRVYALAFLPAAPGRTLLAAADALDVTLWDPVTGERIRKLSENGVDLSESIWTETLAVVPTDDGALLAAAGDSTVRLWNPNTGALVRTLTGHRKPVQALAVLTAADGRTLVASAGEDIRLWDPSTGELAHRYTGHPDALTAMTVVSMPGRGALLATLDAGGAVRLWDPMNGQQVSDLPGAALGTIAAASTADGSSVLLYEDYLSGAHVVDPASGETIRRLRRPPRWRRALRRDHRPWANAFATFSMSGQPAVAAACDDGTIRIWDLASGAFVQQLAAHRGPAHALIAATAPDGRTYLVSGGYDGVLRAWDTTDGKFKQEQLPTNTTIVLALAVVTLPDGRPMLASAGSDNVVRLWDRGSGAWHRELVGHTDWVRALAAVDLPGGAPLLASAGDDGTVRLWDPVTGHEVRRLTGHTDAVRALATVPLPDGRVLLASAGDDGTLRLWNPATGALLMRFGGTADRPAGRDLIGRDALATALATALRPRRPVTPGPDTAADEPDGDDETGPTVITVDGRWGSGKTSLMRLAQAKLEPFESWPEQHLPRPWWRRPLDRPLRRIAAGWRRHLRVVTVDRALAGGPFLTTPPARGSGVLTAWFNPWSHQSGEQVWAGLARVIMDAAEEVLFGSDQHRYWFGRNLPRLDRRAVQATLRRRLLSPLLRTGAFALLVPAVVKLVDPAYRFPAFGTQVPGTALALGLPAALITAGLLHTCWRYIFGAAAGYLPADLFRGPVLGEPLGAPASAASELTRDPLYHARSGYLYLVQHDMHTLLDDLKRAGCELIVFIDDLDRCTPATTRQVFEAISVFLSEQFPATRFVIGLDPVVVAAHMDTAFTAENSDVKHADDPSPGWSFLRKLVQLPIRLPAVPDHGVERLLDSTLGPVPSASAGTSTAGRVGTGAGATAAPNPAAAPPPPPATQAARPDSASEANGADAPETDGAGAPETDGAGAAGSDPATIILEEHPHLRELVRERLLAQPERSVRDAKRLLTVWQFYFRVLDLVDPLTGQAAVDRGCRLVTLAEIITRWPAIQHLLHSTVDGHRGLQLLAEATGEHAWTTAIAQTRLDHPAHATACRHLRDLLSRYDGREVAAIAARLL